MVVGIKGNARKSLFSSANIFGLFWGVFFGRFRFNLNLLMVLLTNYTYGVASQGILSQVTRHF